MEKGLSVLFLCIFFMGAVFAAEDDWSSFGDGVDDVIIVEDTSGDWDDFGDEGVVEDVPVDDIITPSDEITTPSSDTVLPDSTSLDDDNAPAHPVIPTKKSLFTVNFYLAWFFGVIGLLVVGYIVFSFFRKPKNHWKKNK